LLIFSYPSLRSFLLSIAIFLTVLSGCSGQVRFEKQEITIEGRNGSVNLIVEIARTEAQRERGYMFREEVKDGEGMLFIFERDQILSFWMKNTLVPLSIAYISHNGTILEIYDMEPGNLNPVRSSRSARYALEVPQSWFDRVGLGPGDRLHTQGLP
jgi:hypothetical protein